MFIDFEFINFSYKGFRSNPISTMNSLILYQDLGQNIGMQFIFYLCKKPEGFLQNNEGLFVLNYTVLVNTQYYKLFTEKTSIKLKKMRTNLIKVNAESMDPLEIKSEYHTANYTTKIHDTWMFTNSTEVTLHHRITR